MNWMERRGVCAGVTIDGRKKGAVSIACVTEKVWERREELGERKENWLEGSECGSCRVGISLRGTGRS